MSSEFALIRELHLERIADLCEAVVPSFQSLNAESARSIA